MSKAATDLMARRGRGRPPRLSREQIVEAVAALLLADPTAPLTIARAAEAVGAKPMSLYRHFADREDLIAAVARRIFFDPMPRVDDRAPWQEQIRDWMLTVYERARRVPQLLHIMASGESTEWLVGTAQLTAIFERCGVRDDRVVAEAIYWVSTITMGHAMIGAAGSQQLKGERVHASLERLDPADAARVSRFVPRFVDLGRDGFARVVEWAMSELERRIEKEKRKSR
jgi:AcrR family transcriptional regulator